MGFGTMNRVTERKSNATTFKKGHKKVGGAVKGSAYLHRHLMTRKVSEALINGCEMAGADGKGLGGLNGFMYQLAMRFPKQAARLLEKLIPREVNKTTSHQSSDGVYETREQILEAIKARGLPPPSCLIDITPEKVERK